MKKTFLLTIAAVLVCAGCSKETPEQSNDPDAWIYDESLPVPILMGSIGAEPVTKAIVEDLADIQFGIYGLDTRNGQDEWTYGGAYNKSEKVNSILLNNEAAKVESDGKVVFTTGKKYYPFSSANNYTFYAYYPRKSTDTNLKCDPEGPYFYANYSIGYDDILWAESAAEDFRYTTEKGNFKISGYNAAYIRKIKEHGKEEENLPKLKLEHKMTALKFQLFATAEDAQALKDAGATITGLSIDNTYTKGSLIIADRRTGEANKKGQFLPDGSSIGSIQLKTGNTPIFAISDMSAQTDLDSDPNGYTITFGDELLLAPHPETECFEGRLHIRLSGIVQDVAIKLVDPRLDEGKNFEPGMRYTYTIKVKGPEEIIAYAELDKWEDTDGGMVGDEEEGQYIGE